MHRSHFIKLLSALPFLKDAQGMEQLLQMPGHLKNTARMPVLFTGHLDDVQEETIPFIESLRTFGTTIKPSVILVVSAHWLTLGESYITINKNFRSPEYPSIGSPETANYVTNHTGVRPQQRELDHGA